MNEITVVVVLAGIRQVKIQQIEIRKYGTEQAGRHETALLHSAALSCTSSKIPGRYVGYKHAGIS